MPSNRFYHLVDLIHQEEGQLVWERFQTCAPGESFSYCGQAYTDFIPADGGLPAGLSSLAGDVSTEITLPWGSARGLRQLSSDEMIATDYFYNYVLRFMTLSHEDPTFFIRPTPYVVESASVSGNGIALTLGNPTTMVGTQAQLVSMHMSDQKFPELPRADAR